MNQRADHRRATQTKPWFAIAVLVVLGAEVVAYATYLATREDVRRPAVEDPTPVTAPRASP